MNLDDHKFLNMERYILFYSLLKKNESEKIKIRQQKETEEKLY